MNDHMLYLMLRAIRQHQPDWPTELSGEDAVDLEAQGYVTIGAGRQITLTDAGQAKLAKLLPLNPNPPRKRRDQQER